MSRAVHMDSGGILRPYRAMHALRHTVAPLALFATLLAGGGAASSQTSSLQASEQDRPKLKIDFLEKEDPASQDQTAAPAPADAPSPPSSEPSSEPAPQVLREPAPAIAATPSANSDNPADIEAATGGRMGIALVNEEGRVLLGFNRAERFAMCSTFKAPLAAAVLMGAEKKRYGMEGTLSVRQSDLLEYAPAVRANIARGRMSIAELTQAVVEVSDNSAANILLPLVGGPQGLTAFMREHGDEVTRLDRTEPSLNENAAGDERDTTSPEAMARLMADLLFADMPQGPAGQLRGWLQASTTGLKRIRAGLLPGWTAGDKTGTCGNAYNDVGVLRAPDGRSYILAVYLDRPTVPGPKAEAAIAQVTRAALAKLNEVGGGARAPEVVPVPSGDGGDIVPRPGDR